MTFFSKRLPHVVTRADLVVLLAPTYAEAAQVDEAEAHERLVGALADQKLQDELYRGLSEALHESKGARTEPDALMDKLSAAVQKRRSKVKKAPASAAVSACMVRLNLAMGIAPEMMRDMLETPKGKAMLDDGFKQLGAHFLRELIK
jgi:hypothetical protein